LPSSSPRPRRNGPRLSARQTSRWIDHGHLGRRSAHVRLWHKADIP
jgi:hypothetical protein